MSRRYFIQSIMNMYMNIQSIRVSDWKRNERVQYFKIENSTYIFKLFFNTIFCFVLHYNQYFTLKLKLNDYFHEDINHATLIKLSLTFLYNRTCLHLYIFFFTFAIDIDRKTIPMFYFVRHISQTTSFVILKWLMF